MSIARFNLAYYCNNVEDLKKLEYYNLYRVRYYVLLDVVIVLERLEAGKNRFYEIEDLLTKEEVFTDPARLQILSKERSSLEKLVRLFDAFMQAQRDLQDAQSVVNDTADQELKVLAYEEIALLEKSLQQLESDLRLEVLPKDLNDEKNVIMEIRAGTGGEEAALFAGDLYRMYSRYAVNNGWLVDIIDANPTGIGGFKEVVFGVKGIGAFSRLKHESGGHRVQRVPTTETSGRIHTSAATVAVLPEAEDVEIEIDSNELRIDIFHSGGHGGQNVQKVATAVRITHIPTGIVSTCQDERSQLKNKDRAMSVLRTRLLDLAISKQQQETAQSRKSQVGSGDRSEKIRTYNFPQNRVTDHRIGITNHNLDRILLGDLDAFIDEMLQQEQAKRLSEA